MLGTPQPGDKSAAVEEGGTILDGLKRRRKSNQEQATCWGVGQ